MTEREARLRNPILERVARDEPALGMIVHLARSGDIARIAKVTGHDFVFIDTQHGLFDRQTVGHIAQTALAVGIAPIVRMSSVDDPDIPVLLDNGAAGVVFPDVNTAEMARRGVAAAKFAPVGQRSVSGGYPQFDYDRVPVAESTRELNGSTVVVCMIETAEALDNAAEIAAVDGVDGIHVGSNDLLNSVGKPGQVDDPFLAEALEHVVTAARAAGKFAGIGGVRDPERQAAAAAAGFRFLTTHSDAGFVRGAAAEWTAAVRG